MEGYIEKVAMLGLHDRYWQCHRTGLSDIRMMEEVLKARMPEKEFRLYLTINGIMTVRIA